MDHSPDHPNERGPASVPEPPEEFRKLVTGRGINTDPEMLQALWIDFYDELKRIARRSLRGGKAIHTISSTVLVHEAYIRLGKTGDVRVRDHDHFLSLSALAMRQALVDYIRGKESGKRRHVKIPFEEESVGAGLSGPRLLELDQALARMEKIDAKMVRVVECRFFADFSVGETAAALGISTRTVDRLWQKARLMLQHILVPEESGPERD